MRHLLISAAVAIGFLISTSMASAFETTISRIDGGADTIDIGDTVEVEVYFDTEEQNDISIVSVSVLFDPSRFTYVPGASISPSYALYAGRSRGVGHGGVPGRVLGS